MPAALAAVLRAVALGGWPLLACSLGFWFLGVAGSFAWSATWLLDLAWEVTLVLVVGALGSFAVHECGHVLVLLAPRGATGITVERTALRLSVQPHGDVGPRLAVAAALAGPGLAALTGAGILAAGGTWLVAGFHLAHLVFLAPSFGDGRVILGAVRARIRC